MVKRDVTQQIEDFFAGYPLRKYRKGQILIFSGSQAEHIFYLIKGRVKQYDVSYRGDEIIVNIFKPGSFFPMSHAINQTPSAHIFETETDTELKQAPAVEVVVMLKSNPEITFDLLSRVYRGTDGVLERMTRLMKSSARERLVFEILNDAKRFGVKADDGSYTSQINEGELAARSGLSRETVSREMGKLIKGGLLVYKSGKLTVTKPKKLENTLNEVK